MVYEDFTTYTEYDPANEITVASSTHIDFLTDMTDDAYLYKDKGAGHFTNFTHLVDGKKVSGAAYSRGFIWALANALDDFKGLNSASETVLGVMFYESSVGITSVYMYEAYGGTLYVDVSVSLTQGQMYYFKITKSGTSLTCKIYSSTADRSADTNVVDTLSLTLHADHSFRYIYACQSYDDDTTVRTIDIDIENLDLQEGVAHSKTVSEILGLVDSRSRVKAIYRSKSEILGLVDTRARVLNRKRAYSEILGLVDSKSSVHGRYKTVTEVLGLKDTRARVKQIHRTKSEILGLVDSKSSVHGRYKTVTEVLGLKDLDPRINVCPKCKKGAVVLVF